MERGGLDFDDPLRAVGGEAAGLFGEEGDGVAFIEQPQFSAGMRFGRRIDEDATFQQRAVKVGETVTGNGIVSEKLYLVDAGAGGNMNTDAGNAAADTWSILATIDLSNSPSAWRKLSISVDALGNGVASYENQTFNFTTAPALYGSFYTGYRENTQAGSVGVPAYLRPATFAAVPEPATVGLAAIAGMALVVRRRK